jgi:NADP-reducing hydrogenase subunit HndA
MANIKLPENKVQELKDICKQFGNEGSELINVLHAAQGIFGYLPAEVQELVSAELNVSLAHVYGVVTFYSFFSMTPKGEHPISICMGTACYVRGAEKVLDEFKRLLDLKVGETTCRRQILAQLPALRRRMRLGTGGYRWRKRYLAALPPKM